MFPDALPRASARETVWAQGYPFLPHACTLVMAVNQTPILGSLFLFRPVVWDRSTLLCNLVSSTC